MDNLLNKVLDEFEKKHNKAMASLPPEHYAKVKDYHKDANEMLKQFRKGNFSELDKLTSKYIKK